MRIAFTVALLVMVVLMCEGFYRTDPSDAEFASHECAVRYKQKLVRVTSITRLPDGQERVCYVCDGPLEAP